MNPSRILTIATLAALLCSVSYAEDRQLIGRWLCDKATDPSILEFKSDGTFEFIGFPGRAKKTYEMDLSGTPASLRLTFALDELSGVSQLWLDFISKDMIQIRGKETDIAVFNQGSSMTVMCERTE